MTCIFQRGKQFVVFSIEQRYFVLGNFKQIKTNSCRKNCIFVDRSYVQRPNPKKLTFDSEEQNWKSFNLYFISGDFLFVLR